MKNEKYIHLLKTMFWGADPADMQLVSKFNKRSRVLLFGITITNAFQKKLHEWNASQAING